MTVVARHVPGETHMVRRRPCGVRVQLELAVGGAVLRPFPLLHLVLQGLHTLAMMAWEAVGPTLVMVYGIVP